MPEGISGENAYDEYLAVHPATHPGRRPTNRDGFYRWRQDERYDNPGGRCPWQARSGVPVRSAGYPGSGGGTLSSILP